MKRVKRFHIIYNGRYFHAGDAREMVSVLIYISVVMVLIFKWMLRLKVMNCQPFFKIYIMVKEFMIGTGDGEQLWACCFISSLAVFLI